MTKQRPVTYKTTGATLTYAEMGDVVVNSASANDQTVPAPSPNLWYRFSNVGTGIVTIKYGATTITTLAQYEQALLLANGISDWWMSKGGGSSVSDFTDLGDVPSSYSSQGGKLVAVNSGETALEFIAAPESGVSAFTELSDVPSSYSGQAGKFSRVNSGETALEFVTVEPGSGADHFIDLLDAPSSYSGQGGNFVKVNSGETALEFASGSGGAASFVDLDDVPSSYSGQTGKMPIVNSGETALEFTDNIRPKSRIWIPRGTVNSYDDEFNDGSIDSNWVNVDVTSYENSWYEPSGTKSLSGYFPSGKGTFKLCGKLKSFTGLSAPFYIETAVQIMAKYQSGDYPSIGLMFADGTSIGSGIQVCGGYTIATWSSQKRNTVTWSRWTGFNSRTNVGETELLPTIMGDHIYLRLVYESANTYRLLVSIDGVVWYDYSGTLSYTLTPTYFGVMQTNNDACNSAYMGNFKYFRVRSGASANG